MDNYVEVRLHNAESNEVFSIKLSPVDALKVQKGKLWLCYVMVVNYLLIFNLLG